MADGVGEVPPGGEPVGASAVGEGVAFSEELGRAICARVAAGESVMRICRATGMPHRTSVKRWADRDPAFRAALSEALLARRTAQRRRDHARAAERSGRRPAKGGSRSRYTPELGATICDRLANGESLVAICGDPDMPAAGTVFGWVKRHPDFQDAYVAARMMQADYLLDEAREVALGATPKSVWADRLRFDTIRWMTARLAPKKYCEPILLVREAAQVRAEAAAAAQAAAADDRRLTINVVRFERGPNGEVLAVPPRGPQDEAKWLRAYGAPYEGAR